MYFAVMRRCTPEAAASVALPRQTARHVCDAACCCHSVLKAAAQHAPKKGAFSASRPLQDAALLESGLAPLRQQLWGAICMASIRMYSILL